MLIPSVCAVLLTWLSLEIRPSIASNGCGTDQNPYCAGNSILEQLCCPYPNVCYWQNRNGDPGCCPAGQFCDGSYPYYTPTTYIPTTYIPTTYIPTTPCTTTTPNVITITTTDGCVPCETVTAGGGGWATTTPYVVYTTVNNNPGQALTTVNGVIVVNDGAKPQLSATLATVMAVSCAFVWSGFG